MEKTDTPKEEKSPEDGAVAGGSSQSSETAKPTDGVIAAEDPNANTTTDATTEGASRPVSKATGRSTTSEGKRASAKSRQAVPAADPAGDQPSLVTPTSTLKPPSEALVDANNVSLKPKSAQSKRESRAESVMSMTEEEAKAVLQEFLKKNRKRPPAKGKEEEEDNETGSSKETTDQNAQSLDANDEQIDQLVDRIVEKLKPYLKPGALEVIEEKEEEEQDEDGDGDDKGDKEGETNSPEEKREKKQEKAEEAVPERSPSQRSLKTAEKVQNVLDEVEKLRSLIEIGRAKSREGGNQEKELTNVILAMKRKEAKLTLRMKEVEQTEDQLRSRKEILERKEEEVEKYVRELVENTNKLDEKRQELEEKEEDIDKRHKDAEAVQEKCKAVEDELKDREEQIRQEELNIRARASELARREKQVENDKKVNTDQRDRLRVLEERVIRKERELKNDEQRVRELESEIKMQDMDLKFRLEEAKRKEEELKRKMEDIEDENEKLERVLRKIQSEKRRLAEDFRVKQEELTDISARVRKFINNWNRRVGDKFSGDKANGKHPIPDKSLESAISEVESERRMLELEAEIVQQQLELERKGRLLLEQDKVLAELGRLQPLDSGALLSKTRRDEHRLPPLGGKSLFNSPGGRREETPFAQSQRGTMHSNGGRKDHGEGRDSINLESVKSDEGEDHDIDERMRGSKTKPHQASFAFEFTLLNPGGNTSFVSLKTKPIRTIRELKLAMKNQEGIPVGCQKYYSNSRSLTDTTLLQSIAGNTQLRLTIDRGNKMMKVAFPDREEMKLAFDTEETVQFSKIRVFQATGMLPSEFRLYVDGVELKSKNILDDYLKGASHIEVNYA